VRLPQNTPDQLRQRALANDGELGRRRQRTANEWAEHKGQRRFGRQWLNNLPDNFAASATLARSAAAGPSLDATVVRLLDMPACAFAETRTNVATRMNLRM